MNDNTVSLQGVSHSFVEGGRERVVLRAVDAELRAGELVAVLGRSGAGKSTMLNLVGGLEPPAGGRIEVCGVEITALDEASRTRFRRRHVGFVFQFFHLLPTLTVLENVLMPIELERRLRPEDREHALSLLERVGLRDRADAFPDVLSGGEQQRVALARAIVSGPAVLLADEPTGNLDERAAAGVLDLLIELSREHGCTVLMVTHSRSAAARCERVLRIEDGCLVPA